MRISETGQDFKAKHKTLAEVSSQIGVGVGGVKADEHFIKSAGCDLNYFPVLFRRMKEQGQAN